ncbi:MAG: hypothetical protein WCO38_09475 [Verrucomicrobiota bacterium]
MICPKCGYCEEKAEAKKQTDEEFFLEWWTPTIGLEAAKASWEEKQVAIGRETAMVMSDIEGYVSQVDGSWIKSRSHHRSHLKQHKMIELGNDVPTEHKKIELSSKSNEQRKRQIAEMAYEKLR